MRGTDPDVRRVARKLGRLQRKISGRVPNDISLRTARIVGTLVHTLPRTSAVEISSRARHTLVACATDYLPTALHAYMDMPRIAADRERIDGDKTARTLLTEQLELLAREIDDIRETINFVDAERLIAHGRFLVEKFRRSELDLPRGSSRST
jgi:hypothetical protein